MNDKLKEKTGKLCAGDVPPEQLEFILPKIPQVSYNSSIEMGYYFFFQMRFPHLLFSGMVVKMSV